jgi:hypothetical protein
VALKAALFVAAAVALSIAEKVTCRAVRSMACFIAHFMVRGMGW